MNPERWQKLNELFHAAIERGEAERVAFLAEACAGDAALLKEVERLVAAHQGAGVFIQTSAFTDGLQLFAGQEESIATGRQLGAYRVIKEIGRGGMGTVYLAERADEQYEKRVAIKLIKRGMDTDSVLRRFQNERQILATLEHPNIARLLDGGTTEDGLPYFAMEYVEGLPVDAYCDAHRLNITERLNLFRQICSAVSYAHQHLIVHRDIKPSNILVTADGTPKLLDFGIAKIMHAEGGAETLSTVTGLRLLTPEYASPEQVQGLHATTLSDVYSLGIVLYELLSGHSPYRFNSRLPEDIARAISTTEPEKPSTVITHVKRAPGERQDKPALTPERIGEMREGSFDKLRRRLRGDLDRIVLMAMRKEPQRRYSSIEQFSEDIRRHLSGLPVIARADTLSYRAAKFVRRNRVSVATAALVFLTLVGGIIATAWQARRARAQQARAERRFNDVRKLARSVLFDYHDAIKDLPGATPVRARLVRDALEYLDSLAGEAGDDSSLQRELGTAYERVGDVQGGTMFANLGDTAGAIESYRKALKIREALIASDPQNSATRRDIAFSYTKLGNLLWETGDTTGALENNRKALSLFQSLVAEDPASFDLRFALERTYDNLGMILQERGDATGALESYRKALEILESFPPPDREGEKVRRAFSTAYEHIGTAHLLMGDLDTALENNRKALAIRAALSADFPLNADYRRTLVVSYYNDGEILAKMGRIPEALESYRKDLAIAEGLSAADPKNEQYRGDIAYALIRVSDMLARLGDFSRALMGYRKSMSLRAEDVRADPTNLWKRASLIEANVKISKTLAKSGERAAALTECDKTISMMEQTEVEPTNASIRAFFAESYFDLGEAYSTISSDNSTPPDNRQEQWSAACDMYHRSLDILRDMLNRGILSSGDAGKPEMVAREIAKCESLLKK
jgi:eukaryotic-like serine/threonine-protein kinase